jgi:alkanesulfonate monooxygenase SsuD/methylene tetrahydromethanopterin reductase-like flavin-dependent oxidoreductase (luciferase family)
MWILRYDLRAPTWGPATHAELYAACLEQCAWADERGVTTVVLSEHHGIADDGYLSAPMVVAGAIAGRTTRTQISIQALLAPLHDPLRVAEDLAALDLVSGGRVMVTLGLGYRDEEFDMFGVDRKRRAPLLEETIETVLKAWSGEPFEFRGRTVQVTPRPATRPHPMLFVGGSVPAAARRAARFGLPLMAASDDLSLKQAYDEACKEYGVQGGFAIIPQEPAFIHVAEDPEKAWATIGPHVLHDANSYDSWQTPDQHSAVHVSADDIAGVRASGVYQVRTPAETIELARQGRVIMLHPLVGGLPPQVGWESLELFASAVLPHI